MAKTSLEQLGVDSPEVDAAFSGETDEGVQAQEPPQEPPPPDEPPADEPPPAAERPAWLPQNFKTEEDFANSYKSLQNELRQRGNREREYEERMAQLEQQLAAQQQPQQPSYDEDWLSEQYEQNPLAVMQWMAMQAAQGVAANLLPQLQAQAAPQLMAQNEILARTADEEMAARYDDWATMKEQVGDLLTQRPYLLPDEALGSLRTTTDALDTAYKLAKADGLLAQNAQLAEAGVQQADLDRAAKLSAQTLTGASGRPEPVSDTDRELAAMKDALHGQSWSQLRSRAS